ncbi:MAG: MerR family transcriptional regulator [Chloroflexota bacterium]|nr:MerR family transcriptional regulator [Chloroflexota bacterium]
MTEKAGVAAGCRIGELASATGLTVRTLRYYDEIGLLSPRARSAGGHRLYGRADVERLYRIRRLRQLGLTLSEVGHALDGPERDLRSLLSRHLNDLDQRLDSAARLRRRLAHLRDALATGHQPDTRELLEVLEGMTMQENGIQRCISIVVYHDLDSAYSFLVDVFGFGPGELVPGEDGVPVHGEVHAGDGVIWLHRETEEYRLFSARRLGAATASVAVLVDDVDAHHRHVAERGGEVVYPPVDQPYGYREYSVRDLEGGLWSFMRPLD